MARWWRTLLAFDDPRALARAAALGAGALLVASAAPLWSVYRHVPERFHTADRLRIMAAVAGPYASAPPEVLVLGGSQARELLPADDFTAAALTESCGRPVPVLNAGSSAQSPELQAQLLDWWPKAPRLVIISVTQWRLLKPAQPDRPAVATLLPLPSARLAGRDRLWLPATALASAMDLALVRPRAASASPFDTWQHHYSAPGWDGARRLADALFEVSLIANATPTDRASNRSSLVALAQHVQRRGGRPVFLVMPHAPEADIAYTEVETAYRRALSELTLVAPVLDIDDRLIPSDGFFDAVHLLPSGRHAIWPTLRAHIATHLPECRPS